MKRNPFKRFLEREKRELLKAVSKSIFWFLTGIFLGLFLLVSFIYIGFEKRYENRVYPGVTINNVNFSGEKEEEVQQYFEAQNNQIQDVKFSFQRSDQTIVLSAKDLEAGYNALLLAHQAFILGRSQDFISNVSLILQAYINGINLPVSYSYSSDKLDSAMLPLKEKLTVQPVDALFTFQNGKVTAFQPSSDGQTIDMESLQKQIEDRIPQILQSKNTHAITIAIPIKILKPKTTTNQANNLGIKELIASGTSLFQHSIDTRIYNINLAAGRLNGILVAPNETFSFDNALGDVSAFTGYKQAYVIQNGKTVLGDGGGVCQVSTTLFRAILNAGLPILERHAHAYRVGYYEEDSPPGLDATVYVPSIDLRFKNDTGNYILIQTVVDPNELRLTFNLYGTKDGRSVNISTPIVTNQTPAPPPLYQDDPSLPKGTLQQTDFAAGGATATFSRTVSKGGKVILADTYVSNYQPWQAIFLRGTKE